jgi:hypothetical protein
MYSTQIDPAVIYITGKAFLDEVEIGAAFGEFRKGCLKY